MATADALASRLIDARAAGTRLPLPSAEGLDLVGAYGVADRIRARRIAAGERPRGHKIGFTNRGIWATYGVHAPIWAPIWDSTLVLLAGASATVSLGALALVQPRLEPEVVFGFRQTPPPGADEAALVDSLDWVAHGLEVVHTHFDDWRFTAADAVADFGLHGGLWVGPRVDVRTVGDLVEALPTWAVRLSCDAEVRAEGTGAAALGSPLRALRHWLAAMAETSPGWTVQPGDVVTTGTLTDALPVAPGQRWQTQWTQGPLTGLSLDFTE